MSNAATASRGGVLNSQKLPPAVRMTYFMRAVVSGHLFASPRGKRYHFSIRWSDALPLQNTEITSVQTRVGSAALLSHSVRLVSVSQIQATTFCQYAISVLISVPVTLEGVLLVRNSIHVLIVLFTLWRAETRPSQTARPPILRLFRQPRNHGPRVSTTKNQLGQPEYYGAVFQGRPPSDRY